MGDKATLAKARRELEDLYLGIPDESVNLTFQDLAQVKQLHHATTSSTQNKKSSPPIQPMGPISPKRSPSPLIKLPSLDFSKALQASANHHQNNHNPLTTGDTMDSSRNYRQHRHRDDMHVSPYGPGHDDMSYNMSMASMNPYQERGQRLRPGIPHSNICTVCSLYIYFFRHRCLVCGRVYCRQCMSIGMGEMKEGRKCIECLGRRFSQRYIQRAGKFGCWCGCYNKRYPSTVKQQELKWAEKGPRKSGENGYGRNGMISRSRSPRTPRTPNKAYQTNTPPSFVVSSSYSPYSTSGHHIPAPL